MRSNREYREYMTKNASQIMFDNWKTACDIRNPTAFTMRTTPENIRPPIFFDGPYDHRPPFETNETKMQFLKRYN